MIISIDLPEEIKKDISIATAILMSEGCKEVYIFGSLAGGAFSDSSDIDLAIIGLEKKKYFKVYGELLEKIKRPIDLIGLDYDTKFSKKIKKIGKLTRVA